MNTTFQNLIHGSFFFFEDAPERHSLFQIKDWNRKHHPIWKRGNHLNQTPPLGGDNSNIFLFSPRSLGTWWKIWRAYFSDVLVQPPTPPMFLKASSPWNPRCPLQAGEPNSRKSSDVSAASEDTTEVVVPGKAMWHSALGWRRCSGSGCFNDF